MSNGWSVGCKIVAWLTLIGGIIASVITAILLRAWWPLFAVSPSAIVTFLLFGTLGYIAKNVGGGSSYSSAPAPEWLSRYDSRNPQYGQPPASGQPKTPGTPYIATELSDGQWRCTCGRLNQKYVSTCVCGVNKRDVIKKIVTASNNSEQS